MNSTTTASAGTTGWIEQLPRRRFFINKKLQGKMVLWSLVGTGLGASVAVVHATMVAEEGVRWPALLGEVGLCMGLVAFVTVVLSHKLAGPLYSLEGTIRAIGGGEVGKRCKFRQGDALWDLQEKFNGMMDFLQSRVSGEKKALNELVERLEKLVQKENLTPVARGEFIKIQQAIAQICQELSL